MCLIMICENSRPTYNQMKLANSANPDGVGISWSAGKKVHWKKGLTFGQAYEIAKFIPMPFVVHLRYATAGGKKKELTHPFPITNKVERQLKLHGSGKAAVLFHNGHVSDWQKILLRFLEESQKSPPTGEWSDSRVLAWVIANQGDDLLEPLAENNRFAVVTRKQVFYWGTWIDEGGIKFSNRSIERQERLEKILNRKSSYWRTEPSKMSHGGGYLEEDRLLIGAANFGGSDTTEDLDFPHKEWKAYEKALEREAEYVAEHLHDEDPCSAYGYMKDDEFWNGSRRPSRLTGP